MFPSLIILEFSTIATGYAMTDTLLKDHDITLVKTYRICPGKLLVIASGTVEDIRAIEKRLAAHKEVLTSSITGVHPTCIELLKTRPTKSVGPSLAIIEMRHALYAIEVANYVLQHYPIHISKLDIALGLFGKGIVICEGQLADIIAIQGTIEANYPSTSLVNCEIISQPHAELLSIL